MTSGPTWGSGCRGAGGGRGRPFAEPRPLRGPGRAGEERGWVEGAGDSVDSVGPTPATGTTQSLDQTLWVAEFDLFRSTASQMVALGHPTPSSDVVPGTPGPNPRAYLRRCIVNSVNRRARREGLFRRSVEQLPRTGSVEQLPRTRSVIDQPAEMRDLFTLLTLRQRTAVFLRYYLDLSEADMAAAMGCRPGTVKSTLSTALDRLREALDDPRPLKFHTRRGLFHPNSRRQPSGSGS